jgi:hypothetical protein
MRHLLPALAMALLISANATAQNANPSAQKSDKIHFLMLTIHGGSAAFHPRMIVTKEDGTQEITPAAKGSWMDKMVNFERVDNRMAANEDSLFQTLKPYFDAGWQLSGSTILNNNGLEDFIARYYFTRKD